MKGKLAQLEERLQSLIEGGAARLIPLGHKRKDLTTLLLDAMEAGLKTGPQEEVIAPNLYLLQVHPSQARYFSENRSLLDSLTLSLREVGAEARLQFVTAPVIRLVEDASLSPGEVRVAAHHSQEHLTQTTDIEVEPESGSVPPNAFLIVDGMHIINLAQSVINLGRRPDNQVVIDDPRVSRVHAQLRAVRGRYVIFDLNSTGGTLVNGEPVVQHALQAGDVISLAGVPVVYGQDGAADTQDLRPPDLPAEPPVSDDDGHRIL